MKMKTFAALMIVLLLAPLAASAEETATQGKDIYEKQRVRWKERWLWQRKDNESFLMSKLANNTVLTEPQKKELIEYFLVQYKENTSLREQPHKKSVAFFEETANNAALTQDQRKEEIKAYLKKKRNLGGKSESVQRTGKTAAEEEYLKRTDTDDFVVVGTM